jgi:hypothetical protein
MTASIDFSLFHSPTGAFGNVTGEISIPDPIAVGDEVLILEPRGGNWFSGRLRVTSVNQLPSDPGKTLIGLEDVVAPSQELARELVARLENEVGLFFDEYE